MRMGSGPGDGTASTTGQLSKPWVNVDDDIWLPDNGAPAVPMFKPETPTASAPTTATSTPRTFRSNFDQPRPQANFHFGKDENDLEWDRNFMVLRQRLMEYRSNNQAGPDDNMKCRQHSEQQQKPP